VSNLLERAFGGDPAAAGSNLLPFVDPAAPLLSLVYRKATAASDLTFTVEESADLGASSWVAASGQGTVLSEANGVQQIRFTAAPGPTRKFLRVKVTSP